MSSSPQASSLLVLVMVVVVGRTTIWMDTHEDFPLAQPTWRPGGGKGREQSVTLVNPSPPSFSYLNIYIVHKVFTVNSKLYIGVHN